MLILVATAVLGIGAVVAVLWTVPVVFALFVSVEGAAFLVTAIVIGLTMALNFFGFWGFLAIAMKILR